MHWTPSNLLDFESCPALFYRRRILRLPEPKSSALERGNLVHKILEDYMAKDEPLPLGFMTWGEALDELRKFSYRVEELWEIDQQWAPRKEGDLYGRLKTDLHYLDGDHLHVIDYKTGRVYADKHRAQFWLYAIAGAFKYPKVKKVTVEGWYIDQNEIKEETYRAERLKSRERKEADKRLAPYMAAVGAGGDPARFPETPGGACGYCPFHKKRGGPCTSGA